MNAAESANMIWYLLALVLVGSALLSRRFSFRGALGMALAWIVVFAVVALLFSYRHQFGMWGHEVRQRVPALSDQRTEGSSLRIAMAEDGHFWAEGEINGTPARFLIDSGATITALSQDIVRRSGLNVESDGPGVVMQTANGPVKAQRAEIAGLVLGPITTNNLPVVVSDRFGEVNVLGMNFLSRLKSWRVERNEMVLEP